MRAKKRFIAGAVCQACQSSDTLMVYMNNNVETVECVSCGFTMAKPEEQVEEQTRQSEHVIGVFKP